MSRRRPILLDALSAAAGVGVVLGSYWAVRPSQDAAGTGMSVMEAAVVVLEQELASWPGEGPGRVRRVYDLEPLLAIDRSYLAHLRERNTALGAMNAANVGRPYREQGPLQATLEAYFIELGILRPNDYKQLPGTVDGRFVVVDRTPEEHAQLQRLIDAMLTLEAR